MYYYNRPIYTSYREKWKPADQTPTWLHVDKIYILFTMHIICIEIRIFTRKPIAGEHANTYLNRSSNEYYCHYTTVILQCMRSRCKKYCIENIINCTLPHWVHSSIMRPCFNNILN